MYRKTNKLLALLVLALPLAAGALESDREQPIELEADRAEMDNVSGVSVYTGNVILTQGTLKITGDKMTVYQTEGGELDKAYVDGRPATYQQLPDDQPLPVKARAPRMEYYASGPERVRLLQGGLITQGQDEFEGETIVYLVQEDRMQAERGEGEDQRIRIKFFPKEDDKGDAP
ncbi:lipopolysaccharide transport periplasmic protein LptA [Alkalilimnicola sp. S0819]|uniref:lipopolysaccharide transport periplasmic protein LptA n=1 Tax=Alkalilimnicola sp. S0819 TaxID=2613922 RepID=UPI0012628E18|nr:lipopolysaccharide transport periplasmic protein LptA [Alkalilimnicola sp. S0819]KAB7623823.1 lipopolysaccharide transport periplasmic protein LptA [Alkalilimnicola sp. S0819]MPQ16698.1 lipopolysaccharide transport periplasmic protein LptA [Alkalilimnicola sp. S0819]